MEVANLIFCGFLTRGKTETQISSESEKINRLQPSFSRYFYIPLPSSFLISFGICFVFIFILWYFSIVIFGIFLGIFQPLFSVVRTPSIRMIPFRKTSTQASRNSFAMDDRASQDFSTADQNNRNSVVYPLSVEDDKTGANDDNNIDHLKKFETSTFPPEPPLDASRTSLVVTDEELSETDHTQHESESAGEVEGTLQVNEEKPAGESEKSFISRSFIWPFILGLLVLLIGVILEVKFNVIRSA